MSVLPLQHRSDDALSTLVGGDTFAIHQVGHYLRPSGVDTVRCEDNLRPRGGIHVRFDHSRGDLHYVDVERPSFHVLYLRDALNRGLGGRIYTKEWGSPGHLSDVVSGCEYNTYEKPEQDPIFTIVPVLRDAMCGKTARYICKTANTLVLNTAATLSAGMSDIGPEVEFEAASRTN